MNFPPKEKKTKCRVFFSFGYSFVYMLKHLTWRALRIEHEEISHSFRHHNDFEQIGCNFLQMVWRHLNRVIGFLFHTLVQIK